MSFDFHCNFKCLFVYSWDHKLLRFSSLAISMWYNDKITIHNVLRLLMCSYHCSSNLIIDKYCTEMWHKHVVDGDSFCYASFILWWHWLLWLLISDDIFDIVPFGWTSSTANAYAPMLSLSNWKSCSENLFGYTVVTLHHHVSSAIHLNTFCAISIAWTHIKLNFLFWLPNRTHIHSIDLDSEWSKTFTHSHSRFLFEYFYLVLLL